MIKVYNKQTSFIVIGDKYIAPFKSEEFESRNATIRSLERSGIVSVTEIAPSNPNPVTPDLFKYQLEKSGEAPTAEETTNNEDEIVVPPAEESEDPEEIVEAPADSEEQEPETVEEDSAEQTVEEQPKKTRKRKSKKGEN